MPAPLSVDLRQRIIAAYEAQEGSQRQLAERFNNTPDSFLLRGDRL